MTAYSDLLSRVADWQDRTDLTSAQIDSFISLAEARFNRMLIVPERESVATSSATTDRLALPTGFWGMRGLYAEGQVDPQITQMSLVELVRTYSGTTAATGNIRHYAISGGELVLGPTPAAATTLTLDYYAAIPALTSGNTSNWLIAAHPDVYLAAVLTESYIFMRDSEAAAMWDSRTIAKLSEIMKAGLRKQNGAAPLAPSGGVASIRNIRA